MKVKTGARKTKAEFRRIGVLRYEGAAALWEPEQAVLTDAHAWQILGGAQSDDVALRSSLYLQRHLTAFIEEFVGL